MHAPYLYNPNKRVDLDLTTPMHVSHKHRQYDIS